MTFAVPGTVRQGWYLAMPTRRLRRGAVRAVEFGTRRVVLYRDAQGVAHATDEHCPHLGSDLSLAHVTAHGLRCEFHGWCWREDGTCVDAPGNPTPPPRRLRHYTVVERWGFVWVWLGRDPAFALPDVPPHLRRRFVLAPQRVRAHSDVIFSNGFDLAHFGPSHDIDAATADLRVDPWTISHHIVGTLSRRASLTAVGLSGAPLDVSFTQHGGGIVHVHVRRPVEYLIFFTLRADAQLHARTRTMLFLRRWIDLPRALAVLWSTALDDLEMMERVKWTGAFAPSDAALAQYAAFVTALPQW
jgi:phenylpropionate dioxygenase-like ring-hydroxylating dioxygenase large terminal subunit